MNEIEQKDSDMENIYCMSKREQSEKLEKGKKQTEEKKKEERKTEREKEIDRPTSR